MHFELCLSETTPFDYRDIPSRATLAARDAALQRLQERYDVLARYWDENKARSGGVGITHELHSLVVNDHLDKRDAAEAALRACQEELATLKSEGSETAQALRRLEARMRIISEDDWADALAAVIAQLPETKDVEARASPPPQEERGIGRLEVDARLGLCDFHIEGPMGLNPEGFVAIQRAVHEALDEHASRAAAVPQKDPA